MVSVIIPVYNGEQYIEDCILSVSCQSYRDIEIIIVDDGSTDNTPLICKKMSEIDDRISVITLSKNHGLPFARDYGIKVSKCELITFVDADDLLPELSIEKRVNLIDEYDMVLGDYRVFGIENMSSVGLTEKTTSSKEILEHLFLDYKYGFQGYRWNKLFRKSILNLYDYSYDDILYNEDRLFVCKYLVHSKTVKIIPDVVYHYRKHGDSMTRETDFNYAVLTGLNAFDVMEKDLIQGNYLNAHCLCCANAIFAADTMYDDVPYNDEKTKVMLMKYMKNHYQNIISHSIKMCDNDLLQMMQSRIRFREKEANL